MSHLRENEQTEGKLLLLTTEQQVHAFSLSETFRIALGRHDSNDIQLSTTTAEVSEEDTAKKYEAWNWNVMTINGNDPQEIYNALKAAQAEDERPTLIIGKTIMGKGAVDASGASFEGQTSTHGMPLSAAGASYEKFIANLGGNPENPFEIFPEVKKAYLGG